MLREDAREWIGRRREVGVIGAREREREAGSHCFETIGETDCCCWRSGRSGCCASDFEAAGLSLKKELAETETHAGQTGWTLFCMRTSMSSGTTTAGCWRFALSGIRRSRSRLLLLLKLRPRLRMLMLSLHLLKLLQKQELQLQLREQLLR
ncbi:hypothetical protein MLD38_025586 [Melastoma candidum]|uniref:Uncharacterized protein n=1 Tax=Melastoma candidum TaxID=119954 RepID=A0ACB9NVT1_9MYRT|nr:hypothetical protein MLD38_025586 [Melastoma candidum]